MNERQLSGQEKYVIEEAQIQLERYQNAEDCNSAENTRGQIAMLEIIEMGENKLSPNKLNPATKKIRSIQRKIKKILI